MKNRTQTIVILLMFLIFVFSLLTGGCLEQSSLLKGENGKEQKEEIGNDRSSSTGYLKTEAVNLSGFEAVNSSLAGNYRLEALDIELKGSPVRPAPERIGYYELRRVFCRDF